MGLDRPLTFDRFRLDPVSGQLFDESRPVSLTPKAFSLLEYLAARPGRLVSKAELLDALWPRVFVADGALKVCIREIRRALGDDARTPRVIETAHRRGYRFIADVAAASPVVPPPVVPSPAVALPAADTELGTARRVVAVGETYEFEYEAQRGRKMLWLEVRSTGGRWQVQGQIVVR